MVELLVPNQMTRVRFPSTAPVSTHRFGRVDVLNTELIGIAGFVIAATAMALIHGTRERVTWPAWLVPLVVVIPFAGWTGFVIFAEGLKSFFPVLMETRWGLLVWYDRLMSLTAAYYLLQNRARAAGMKSDLWVIAIAATGSIALLLMLARTVYLEDKQSARNG